MTKSFTLIELIVVIAIIAILAAIIAPNALVGNRGRRKELRWWKLFGDLKGVIQMEV